MFRKKILIIDDMEMMVKLISNILVPAGYEVVSANNAYEGLRKVRETKPDLVILDIIMPGMSGFEVCKILRDDESNNLMPIIIISGKDDEGDKLTGLELGADDYIIKPFNPRELISRVNNTLKRIDRNRWANPLTGLQGNIEIQTEINHRIAKEEAFTVIYADLDNFKAYNDVYGFASGDTAIKLTADIVVDSTRNSGSPGDFVGHVGGDDFVIITSPDFAESIAKSIIETFDRKILAMYNQTDRDKGFITTSSRQGEIINYPIMSISLGIVSNTERELISHIQVAEIAAELKRKAKSLTGSVYVKDNRKQ